MDRIVASDSGDERANDLGANPSFEDLFDVLSHHRRRYVVECLIRYGSPMTLPDLADECVMMEHQRAVDSVPAETVKRMYMSLYHTHIPKLVDSDAVEYDQESDSVALCPNAGQLEAYLTLTRTRLSPSAADALSALRSVTATDDLTTDRAITVIQDEECSTESEARQLLHQFEDKGYIHIVDGEVRLIE
jgi:hypothetical protein